MPFKKVNVSEMIRKERENDPEFNAAWEKFIAENKEKIDAISPLNPTTTTDEE